MTKRARKHKELVKIQKMQKHAKRACERWGLDYKKNPYCIGVLGNNSEIFYPCLKYVK